MALYDVCDLVPGFAFKSENFGDYKDKVIKIGDIVPPDVDMEHLPGVDISCYNKDKLKQYLVSSGDYVLAMTGSTIGKVGRIRNGQAYINQRVLVFRPKDVVDSDYLYYVLSQPLFRQFVVNHADSETAKPNISASSTSKFSFNLPPIEIQRKIGGLLSALDDKIAINKAINKNLEATAQAIFKSWFIDFEPFGGIMPADWKKDSLSNIAKYTNGLAMQNYRPVAGDIGLPVLKIKELRQGMCDTDSDLCSSEIDKEFIIHDGDVIFSWSGSLLVDLWCGGICGLNQHLFKVTSDIYDKWFYYSWTQHHLVQFQTIASAKATTMGHIKRGDLEKATVVIPSQEDYQSIGNLLRPIYDTIISNKVENKRLAEIRDALLPKLMSGEIDVSQVKI